MKSFYVRAEESIEDAIKALERGRSVRRWATLGAQPYEHLMFASADEKREILEAIGIEDAWMMTEETLDGVIADMEFGDAENRVIIEKLGLEPFGNGYAAFLDGLCALEWFDEEPTPEDCTATLDGSLFGYLVCYEGDYAGADPDEGWPLFHPVRIVWATETGSDDERIRI